jgi:hypothetical protein
MLLVCVMVLAYSRMASSKSSARLHQMAFCSSWFGVGKAQRLRAQPDALGDHVVGRGRVVGIGGQLGAARAVEGQRLLRILLRSLDASWPVPQRRLQLAS